MDDRARPEGLDQLPQGVGTQEVQLDVLRARRQIPPQAAPGPEHPFTFACEARDQAAPHEPVRAGDEDRHPRAP